MDQYKALEILQKYSPMPDDDELTEKIVDEYRTAIDYFDENHPGNKAIGPLINSLGAYDGWGVYEVTRSIIVSYDSSQVIPFIREGILSKINGRRYWCTLLATDFPHDSLIPMLLKTLNDPVEDIRVNSIMALESIGETSVINDLIKRSNIEKDEVIIEAIQEAIQTLKSNL